LIVTFIVAGPVGGSAVFTDVAGVIVGTAAVGCWAALGVAVEAKAGVAMALSATSAPPVRTVKHRLSIIEILS
jgi:hypothetical protein